uniref:Uncharacterized protein n=1 Tax=Solanum tuberosum TaxID=4113 RepID=M1DMI8_SOLTU
MRFVDHDLRTVVPPTARRSWPWVRVFWGFTADHDPRTVVPPTGHRSSFFGVILWTTIHGPWSHLSPVGPGVGQPLAKFSGDFWVGCRVWGVTVDLKGLTIRLKDFLELYS